MPGQKLEAEDQSKINKILESRRFADSIDDDEHGRNPCNRVKIGVVSRIKPKKNRTAKAKDRCCDQCAGAADMNLPGKTIGAKHQQIQMAEKGDIGRSIQRNDPKHDVWGIKQSRLDFSNQRNAAHQVRIP